MPLVMIHAHCKAFENDSITHSQIKIKTTLVPSTFIGFLIKKYQDIFQNLFLYFTEERHNEMFPNISTLFSLSTHFLIFTSCFTYLSEACLSQRCYSALQQRSSFSLFSSHLGLRLSSVNRPKPSMKAKHPKYLLNLGLVFDLT